VRARQVALACGHSAFRHVPSQLCHLPPVLVSHAADHCGFGRFEGKEVAVIGGGQSALESAALLLEQRALPQVFVRKPFVAWNDVPEMSRRPVRRRLRAPIAGLGAGWPGWFCSELPAAFAVLPRAAGLRLVRETFGPAGAWGLRPRVDGRIPVHLGRTLVDATAEKGKVRLRFAVDGGPEEHVVDHVLSATGYRVDL